MFSVPDILVVSVLALLLFGPDRLPKLMRQAGRFMREVQNTSHGFVSEMERAADLADNPVPPYRPPSPETVVNEHEAAPNEHEGAVNEPAATEPAMQETVLHEPALHEPGTHEHDAAAAETTQPSPPATPP
jgi:TatA/E family protein of Tat protein translocase